MSEQQHFYGGESNYGGGGPRYQGQEPYTPYYQAQKLQPDPPKQKKVPKWVIVLAVLAALGIVVGLVILIVHAISNAIAAYGPYIPIGAYVLALLSIIAGVVIIQHKPKEHFFGGLITAFIGAAASIWLGVILAQKDFGLPIGIFAVALIVALFVFIVGAPRHREERSSNGRDYYND